MIDHPALPFLKRSEKGKVVSAADAVQLIRDGDTLATGGFVGIGFAEEIVIAIEDVSSSRGTWKAQPPASPEVSRSSMRPGKATAIIVGSITLLTQAW